MPKISNEGVLTINIVWCKSKYRRVPCHVASHLNQGSVDGRVDMDDVNLSSRKDLTSGSEFMTLKNFEKQEELRSWISVKKYWGHVQVIFLCVIAHTDFKSTFDKKVLHIIDQSEVSILNQLFQTAVFFQNIPWMEIYRGNFKSHNRLRSRINKIGQFGRNSKRAFIP